MTHVVEKERGEIKRKGGEGGKEGKEITTNELLFRIPPLTTRTLVSFSTAPEYVSYARSSHIRALP